MNTKSEKISYREVQYFRQSWILLFTLAATGLVWYGFILQIVLGQEFGTNPSPDWGMWLIWLIVGIGLPLLIYMAKLVIEVRRDYLFIQFIPFTSRKIGFDAIEHVKSRTYNPIREYGGWGIRWGFGKKRAYNISGNQGVDLTLNNGENILIGSQNSDELASIVSRRVERSQHENLRIKSSA
ncbi:DUF6141 family protein [Chloroflexota bacterium]